MNLCPSPMPTGYDCTASSTMTFSHQLTPEVFLGWVLFVGTLLLGIAVIAIAWGWAWRLGHKGV